MKMFYYLGTKWCFVYSFLLLSGGQGPNPDPSKDCSKAFRDFEGSFPKLKVHDRAVHE